MVGILDDICKPVEDWYNIFKSEAADALRPNHPFLKSLSDDSVINLAGKHLRPILTLLVAKSFGRQDVADIISSAVSVELIHTASLIHDDILDEAAVRHNLPTVNEVVGSHAAVLVGDYVLSKGVYYSISKGNLRCVRLLVETMEQLVEGELMQQSYSDNLDIDREGYFKLISLKTSSLISVAARLGAPESFDSSMKLLGEYIGGAFQIKDDILDIFDGSTGKGKYNDFKERKITLPLILAMEKNPSLRNRVSVLLSGKITQDAISELVSYVDKDEIIQSLSQILEDYSFKAKKLVEKLPDSDAKLSLFKFVDFVTRRDF